MSDINLQQTKQEVDEFVNGDLVDEFVNGALSAICILIVVQLLGQESLDIPLTISLYCFAIAIPLLALITFFRRISPALKRFALFSMEIKIPSSFENNAEFQSWLNNQPIRIPITLGLASKLFPLVGIISFFWHFSGWVAFIFLLSGFIGWFYTFFSLGMHIHSELEKLY